MQFESISLKKLVEWKYQTVLILKSETDSIYIESRCKPGNPEARSRWDMGEGNTFSDSGTFLLPVTKKDAECGS